MLASEHIDHAGIVHMNGRIYDPVLGRFLQADPVVQAPDNSQNLNRYSYVLNNPLSYTDPSGFFFKAIGNFIGKFWQPILAIGITVVSAGVATGALFASLEIAGTSAAWGVAIGGGALAGLVNAGNLRGALYGAFSAAAFHGVGTYFNNIAKTAAKDLSRFGKFVADNARLTKTIAHGLTGGIMNELQGGKFAHGFLSAGATQAFAPSIESIGLGDGSLSFGDRALRVASAAALGGAVSEVTGGKFANGAVTGAFSRTFNDSMHDLDARFNPEIRKHVRSFPPRRRLDVDFDVRFSLDGIGVGVQGKLGVGGEVGGGVFNGIGYSSERGIYYYRSAKVVTGLSGGSVSLDIVDLGTESIGDGPVVQAIQKPDVSFLKPTVQQGPFSATLSRSPIFSLGGNFVIGQATIDISFGIEELQ